MAFTSAINTSLPTGSEDASTLDNIIREVRTQMKQRFDSLTTGSEVDPMILKAGAIPTGYSLSQPVIANPTITSLVYRVENETTDTLSNGTQTDIVSLAVVAGTYVIIAKASCAIEGGSSGNIFRMVLSSTVGGTLKEAYIEPNTSGPLFHDLIVTDTATFASAATLKITVTLTASSATARKVFGTDTDNRDTSITAIRIS